MMRVDQYRGAMEYEQSIWRWRLGQVHFMAQMGMLVTLLVAGYFILYYFYPIDFKTARIASVKNILFFYQKRFWALATFAVVLSYITFSILRRFSDMNWGLIYALIPLGIFYGSSFWFLWNAYSLLLSLNIPISDGVVELVKFVRNFNLEITQRLLKIPDKIEALKLPFYIMVYSYLFIMIVAVFVKRIMPDRYYDLSKNPIKKLHIIFSTLFFALFLWSSYVIVMNCIIGNPFYYFDLILMK